MKTVDILENLRYLPGEIIHLEDAIAELEDENKAAVVVDTSLRSETISLVKERLRRCNSQLQNCVDIITSVEEMEPYLYEILTMRFIKGMSWVQIASAMKVKATPDSYKQRVHRWAVKRDKEVGNNDDKNKT